MKMNFGSLRWTRALAFSIKRPDSFLFSGTTPCTSLYRANPVRLLCRTDKIMCGWCMKTAWLKFSNTKRNLFMYPWVQKQLNFLRVLEFPACWRIRTANFCLQEQPLVMDFTLPIILQAKHRRFHSK